MSSAWGFPAREAGEGSAGRGTRGGGLWRAACAVGVALAGGDFFFKEKILVVGGRAGVLLLRARCEFLSPFGSLTIKSHTYVAAATWVYLCTRAVSSVECSAVRAWQQQT